MDFSWNEDQEQLRGAVLHLARTKLGPDMRSRDRAGVFDRGGWDACGELGVMGLTVPTEYGGLGGDALTLVAALESLGYGSLDNGLSFSIGAHLLAVLMPIVEAGTEEQKRHYLPRLASGRMIGANAMSEPSSGSDAFSLRTTAVRDGEKYVITGTKAFTTNAPVADVFLVFAKLEGSSGKANVSAFLVDRNTPGLTLGSPADKLGMRTSPMSEVFLDGCRVPETARLGPEGGGELLFTLAMVWERAFILAPAVGAMQRLFEACVRYARERKQFGQPVGKFQLVASKLVDMRLSVETSRSLLYRTAWQKTQGDRCLLESALTKLHVSEAWVQCAQHAVQIHGGNGYMEDYDFARELRDATGSLIYSGTSEIQRVFAASMIGV